MKLAFADRAKYFNDPQFANVPTETLLLGKKTNSENARQDTTAPKRFGGWLLCRELLLEQLSGLLSHRPGMAARGCLPG